MKTSSGPMNSMENHWIIQNGGSKKMLTVAETMNNRFTAGIRRILESKVVT